MFSGNTANLMTSVDNLARWKKLIPFGIRQYADTHDRYRHAVRVIVLGLYENKFFKFSFV